MRGKVDFETTIDVIEFMGLPGSGKTFLANELGQRCSFPLFNINSRRSGPLKAYFRYSFLVLKFAPLIVRILFRTVKRNIRTMTPIKVLELKNLVRLFIHVDRLQSRGDSDKGTRILDQGIFQTICAGEMAGLLFAKSAILLLLKKVGYGPGSCLVVFHKAELIKALQSIYERTDQIWPMIEGRNKHEVSQCLDRFKKSLISLESLLKLQGFSIVNTYRDDEVSVSLGKITRELASHAR